MAAERKLDGSVYIAGVGAEYQQVASVLSYVQLQARPGDRLVRPYTPTKGYEGRGKHIADFLETEHDFIFMVDLDMHLPQDALERLRSHGLPYVAGLAMLRAWNPLRVGWYEDDPDFNWPMRPWCGPPPARGRLHRIGAAGWACTLIHRSVFEGVAPLLKGEPFVIEDDMDVWPYDLAAVLRGEEQLRPLRGDKAEIVGSDLRFCFFARQAGFTLWGDPDVRPGHVAAYPITPDDYEGAGQRLWDALGEQIPPQIEQMRQDWRAGLARLNGKETRSGARVR